MGNANGLGAAATEEDSPTLVASGAADPTPAGLAALAARLGELGHPGATIADLAGKLGVKRPTLIRWINKNQPFPPETREAAREQEQLLQAGIERLEAESGNEPATASLRHTSLRGSQDAPSGSAEAAMTRPREVQAGGGGPEGPRKRSRAAPPSARRRRGTRGDSPDDDAELERLQRMYAPASKLDREATARRARS